MSRLLTLLSNDPKRLEELLSVVKAKKQARKAARHAHG